MILDLTTAISYLLKTSDRFYANLIQQMDRIATTSIPTAGISVKNRLRLTYNPEWFSKLSTREQAAILKHECLHLICEHLERVKAFSPDSVTFPFYNMCMDATINCLIPELPDELPGVKDDEPFKPVTMNNLRKDYPTVNAGMPFEYYINFFREEEQNNKRLSKMLQELSTDDHSGMYEKGNGSSEEQRQAVKYAVKRAVEATKGSHAEVPKELSGLIATLMKSKNNWERELRKFPDDAEVVNIEPSRKLRNRRYGLLYPGQKKLRRREGVLAFDTSGSMLSEEVISKLMANVNKILESGVKLKILFFGSEVVKEEVWERVPDLRKYQVPDGGGTAFQPVYDRVRELKPDFFIMLTDGYNFDEITARPTCPTLFGILGNDGYQPGFGKVIHIEAEAI